MSARLYLTVYEPDDLPTEEAHIASKSIGTVNACTELEAKEHLHGTGAIRIKISRHHSQADLLQRDRYVLVHSDGGVVAGGFLEKAEIDLSSKDGRGGEYIVWTGRGPMAVLERGVMDTDSDIDLGQDPIDGYWDLDNQGPMAGDSNAHPIPMLKRALVEIGLNDPNGISPVDHSSWTYDTDSASAAVPFLDGEAQGANVGDDGLTLLARMDQLGGVVFRMSPLFKLDAYLTYGTDRSGAFGAGTVRFEKGVNVAATMQRKVRGAVNRTHLIVGGAERSYATVVDPDYAAGDVVRWGFLSVPEASDPTQLEAAGLAHIEARKRQTDTWVLPQHDHGDTPADGIYEPAPGTGHYWLGDSVSLHSGTGLYDANEEVTPIAAITWQLKTGDEANGDYWVIPEVGSTFNYEPGPANEGTVPGSQHRICLVDPTIDDCVDVTATFAPDNFDCDVPISTGGHWYQGGIDTNDGSAGYYHFHSLPNPWAGYAFSDTWVAGQPHTVQIRLRVAAGAAPCTVTLGFATGLRSFTADKVTFIIGESDWTVYDLEWTPQNTYVCDGVFNHDNVKIDLDWGSHSVDGVDFDGQLVCIGTTQSPHAGSQPCAARGDHDHATVGAIAPGADDDGDAGHAVGTVWYDNSTGDTYILVDNSTGAAVWELIGGASTAEDVSYDNTTSGLTADDVQEAIDELDDRIDTLEAAPGAASLDDLDDVVITSPATADRLRFNGTSWINSALIWRPVMTFDGTNWQVAVDGDGNAVMTEA